MRYFVEQVAAGAAILDANGDGYPDLYFPAPKPLPPCKFPQPLKHRLYLNDGKGHFRLAANAFGGSETDYGIAAAVGDYDNDGHPDLFVACHGRCSLFRNRGDGTFQDVTNRSHTGVTGFCAGAAWFDYDGDGLLDLYICRYCEWTLAKNLPCPGPGGDRAGCDPTSYAPSLHVLLHNNGDGTFTDVSNKVLLSREPRRGLGVAAADFDGDGRVDLFVANDMGPNVLYRNRSDGKLEDIAMQQGVAFGASGDWQANMGVAVGDYNDSGRLSVAVTTFVNEPYTLYRNEGGYFTDASLEAGVAQPTMPYLGFGAGFFDSRNVGRLDLFFANGHVVHLPHMRNAGAGFEQRNQLLLNDGTGHFVECHGALPQTDVRVHRAAGFADFNGDGRIDVVTSASNGRPTLLRNDSAPANWLILKLTNRHGCVTPIGARCVAVVNGRRLNRVVLGGGSYGGDSDHRVHFGLGGASRVEQLEIHWPYGGVQVLKSVAANQVLSVREDSR